MPRRTPRGKSFRAKRREAVREGHRAIHKEHESISSREGTPGAGAQQAAKEKAAKFERSFERKQAAAQKRQARGR
jgi:hypothetical protein